MTLPPIVILAAGKGTRMRQLRADTPKHLLEVAGKPFLEHVLDRVRTAGYERIILVVGHYAEQVAAFARTLPYEVELVNQFEQFDPEERYGTAVAVQSVAETLAANGEGDTDFVFMNGDNLFDPEDLTLLGGTREGAQIISGMEHGDPARFGVLELTEDGDLLHIVEKPEHPKSNLVNIGLYRFTQEVFDVLPKLERSPRGEYELTDAVNVLAKTMGVRIHRLQGSWHDFGRPEDIPEVEKFITG